MRIYRSKKLAIKPVVAEILAHPKLYANLDRPAMVKPPLVYLAGALRTTGVEPSATDSGPSSLNR